jgi:hypothetical protein
MLHRTDGWQVGQPVEIRDLDKGYQISPRADGLPGLLVAEVGADYLVLSDPEAGVLTRIPAYLILAADAVAVAAQPVAREQQAA